MPQERAIISGLSGRYATALFELAREQDTLAAVERDLTTLERLLAESAPLRQIVRSPVMTRAAQAAAMAELAGRAGLADLTTRFLGVLATNRRLAALADIIRDFRRLMAAHRGEIRAEVTAARPLDEQRVAALKAKLKAIVGREVTVDAQVDEALIGGLVVRIGSRMIDGSIATKLARLERAMKGM